MCSPSPGSNDSDEPPAKPPRARQERRTPPSPPASSSSQSSLQTYIVAQSPEALSQLMRENEGRSHPSNYSAPASVSGAGRRGRTLVPDNNNGGHGGVVSLSNMRKVSKATNASFNGGAWFSDYVVVTFDKYAAFAFYTGIFCRPVKMVVLGH